MEQSVPLLHAIYTLLTPTALDSVVKQPNYPGLAITRTADCPIKTMVSSHVSPV